jgi:hypothetical protein
MLFEKKDREEKCRTNKVQCSMFKAYYQSTLNAGHGTMNKENKWTINL